ncbi:hypothetical protein FBT96_16210 [Rhodobacter capsulatus]|uniref:Uncharacterized protein n=1 Tax=Rhodobacter capsulatus TaxID=1061 RepID=A0A4U1JMJ5_RHOCA|nr:hypothetical protein [Rhodobacter capsulatus]TKD15616.1 hypothetical protein FBT96_16210 [Rhodobacter capsulatus]
MLSEYAVDPAAIGADWRTFKDLIDRFGADKGRLISRLPTKWEKKVIQAAKQAGVPDIRVSSIIERLAHSKHKVVDFNRAYDHEADWIGNALREHGTRPFRAIICDAGNAACAEAMEPDDCSDAHPLFRATTSCDVTRTADQIADALHTLTAVSKEIDIVDPYFDLRPAKGNYLATLASLLARLAGAPDQTKAIKIHFRDHDTRPPAEILARDGSAQIKGLLPPGYRIEFYAWSEKLGGEDFHDRYVLTELGGIMIGAGLSADGSAESAAFTLLNFEHAQGLRSRFSDGSTIYSRVGLAVRIRDDGGTELF